MVDGLKAYIGHLDKKIQKNKKYRIYLVTGLMLLVFVLYFSHGMQFIGPNIVDEMGFLTKALALSGVSVDAASSWQAGYSLLILPAFVLFHDPDMQWRAVLFINALMWSASAGLLYYFLRQFFQKKSNLTIASVVALSFCYPGFISISGYAYANSGYVFILMLSLAALIKSKLANNRYLIIFSLLAGFLCWIHPLGLVFVAVSVAYITLRGVYCKSFKNYLPSILIMLTVAISYYLIIHPWLNHIVTPDGMAIRNQYDDFFINLYSRIIHPSYWVQAFTLFVGQISFLLVATFGMVAFSVRWLLSDIGKSFNKKFKKILNDMPKSILMIILVTIILVALVESLYFPADVLPFRASMWTYGRYVEMLALPVIGVGLLSKWGFKTAAGSVVIAIFAGVLLMIVPNTSNTDLLSIWEVHISSFWPVVFYNDLNFLIWFLIGGVGILFVGFAGLKNKKWLALLMLPILLLAISNQSLIQRSYYIDRSASHTIKKIITDNFNKGSCVGLDSRTKSRDGALQYGYYTFYLGGQFHVSRMQPDEWFSKCDGPFLTYDTKFVEGMKNVKVVAQDIKYGLYIVIKDKEINLSPSNMDMTFVKYFIEWHPGCKVKGCMDWSASSGDLSFTKVGEYRDGALYTTGQEGYLFIGPKVSVDSDGTYMIKIKGEFRKLDSLSRLKVTSNDGKTINRLAILDQESNNHEIIFQISKPVDDLQIMIYVGEYADITLDSYEVDAVSAADVYNRM